jgi:anti-sigma B factor antagonist
MSRIEADRKILTIPVSWPYPDARSAKQLRGIPYGVRFASGPRITVIQGKMHVDQEKDPPPLELSHRILDTGGAVVEIGGELDVATADAAFGYVREIIDDHGGPVVVSLAGVRFCDARGLYALVRIARYAEQAGCPFRVTSPGPRVIQLMRITGLGETFLAAS